VGLRERARPGAACGRERERPGTACGRERAAGAAGVWQRRLHDGQWPAGGAVAGGCTATQRRGGWRMHGQAGSCLLGRWAASR